MKHVTFYLDFISPYAYLAFEKLPLALQGISHTVTYQPVFLGGLLQHHGVRGPAEVPAKRDWLYRQVQWLAHAEGIALDLPAVHPFNPLPLLRLALACDPRGLPGRHLTEALFHHVWHGGADAADPVRWAALLQQWPPLRDLQGAEVKTALKQATDMALQKGVFGVPSFEVDGKLFWGMDALPMLRAYCAGDAWFGGPAWDAASRVAQAAGRT
jgi:2-hydroxychromene-2-carboxylate isomerase